MNKINKRLVGSRYEDMACAFLEEQGLKIIERNFRVRAGEIDIIAKDGEYLVFAEVKYRSTMDYGGAWYAIPYAKQKKIILVAKWYMSLRRLSSDTLIRFDAVLIDGINISHIKKAW